MIIPITSWHNTKTAGEKSFAPSSVFCPSFQSRLFNQPIFSSFSAQEEEDTNRKGVLDALRIPSIQLAVYSILCASSSIGFLLTALEPFLRKQFDLSPLTIGESHNIC